MANEGIDYKKITNDLNASLNSLNVSELDEVINVLSLYTNIWDANSKKVYIEALKKIKTKYNKLSSEIKKSSVQFSSMEGNKSQVN